MSPTGAYLEQGASWHGGRPAELLWVNVEDGAVHRAEICKVAQDSMWNLANFGAKPRKNYRITSQNDARNLAKSCMIEPAQSKTSRGRKPTEPREGLAPWIQSIRLSAVKSADESERASMRFSLFRCESRNGLNPVPEKAISAFRLQSECRESIKSTELRLSRAWPLQSIRSHDGKSTE